MDKFQSTISQLSNKNSGVPKPPYYWNSKKSFLTLILIIALVVAGIVVVSIYISNLNQLHFGADGYRDFDLSADDSTLVFSYVKNDSPFLYVGSLKDMSAKKIPLPETLHPIFARFFSDWKKISFISYDKPTVSNIYLVDTDGQNLRQLTAKEWHITEAVPSRDGRTIYFLKSGVYKNYSPIARARPHDFDVFSVSVDGEEVRQLTYQKAYEMSNLALSSDEKFLLVSTETTHSYIKIPLSDQTKFSSSGAEMPPDLLSHDGKFVVISKVNNTNDSPWTYDLYVREVASGTLQRVTTLNHYAGSPVFFHLQNRILFLYNESWGKSKEAIYNIMAVDSDGSNISALKFRELP